MSKVDYEELYSLLFNMKESTNLSELAAREYCSVSKVSKMISHYEKILSVNLYNKKSQYILSDVGEQMLEAINAPLEQLRQILKVEMNIIGVDENLIEDEISETNENECKYLNSQILIDQYNCGKLNQIIVSSDYEKEIKYSKKIEVIQKPVYLIKSKSCETNKLYANGRGCPITKKLISKKIEIDEFLTQSVAICKMVRQGKGSGHTFSVDTIDAREIEIQEVDNLKIQFNLYIKY